MRGWAEWAYPLPDDGFETLERIMMSLPEGSALEMVWEPMPCFLVAVADPAAALFLALAVENGCPTYNDGTWMLSPDEVLVGADERSEVERLLAENCPSEARWFAMAMIAFANTRVHRDFAAAYTKLIAIPAPPCDPTTVTSNGYRG
jgi:hypothetical protein